MATRSVSRAAPSGVGEVPQVERAIVEDAVIAAAELHEAGDGAVVDDAGVVAGEAAECWRQRDRTSAPMLPSLFRVAVPPVELRITPAAGRAKSVLEPTPVTPACHPPITDTPCATLTATLPPGVPGSPLLIALIPVLNCPVVETLLSALTCTVPVVEAAQMPCASAPCVVIAPDAVTVMFPPGSSGAPCCVALCIVPLSATMPSASAPFVVIGPDEATVTPPLLMPGPPPLRARARMPMPLPALGRNARAGVIHQDWRESAAMAQRPNTDWVVAKDWNRESRLPNMLMVDAASTVIFLPTAAVPDSSAVIAGSQRIPRVVAADDDRGAGQGGNLGRPVPLCSREDADGIASLYGDRAAAVDYRCVAGLSLVRPRLGEQADRNSHSS